MDFRSDQPLVPAVWERHDAVILPLWRDRLRLELGALAASRYAAGLFFEDRRRPIAQWFNPALDAALLVGPETPAEWPVQRFGLFYAPPRGPVQRVHMDLHEWFPLKRRLSPTEDEAFRGAIVSAEFFLQVEMDFL